MLFEKVNGYLKDSLFQWIIGILIVVLMTTFGYLLNIIRNVEAKVDNVKVEVNNRIQEQQISAEKINGNINAQLSEIKTDLKWIRQVIEAIK